jgi:hypothetical protein
VVAALILRLKDELHLARRLHVTEGTCGTLRHVSLTDACFHKQTPNGQLVSDSFDRAHRSALKAHRQIAALPDTDPAMEPVNDKLRRVARLYVSGTRDYVVCYRDGTGRIEEGDPKLARGLRLYRSAFRQADDVYQQLGGSEHFEGRLDFERLARMARLNG